jgi:hypothetical protein
MLLFVWIAFAVITALAAQARGRSFWGWLAIGALTGVFGLIAVLVMERGQPAAPAPAPPGFAPLQRTALPPRPEPADVLQLYKGFRIRRGTGAEVSTDGQTFPTLAEAKAWIDDRDPAEGLAPGDTVETHNTIRIVVGPKGYRAGGMDFATIDEARRYADRLMDG